MNPETPIVALHFKNLVDHLLEEGKIKSKSDLARVMKSYNHVVTDIMKGKRNITLDQINLLIEEYRINVNYLFGHSDLMFIDEEPDTVDILSKIEEGRNNIVMVSQKAMGGYAMAATETERRAFLEEFKRFSLPSYEGELVAFEVAGDSMLPNITSGDVVICEPCEKDTPIKDGNIYVVVTDVVVVKRLYQIKQEGQVKQFRLESDNKVYSPYNVEAEEVTGLLRVKGRITKYGIE